MLDVFIGWDSRESVAYHVAAHSLIRRSSVPVSIRPLVQSQLRTMGVYTRERRGIESTQFSMTRFLVPYLMDYKGWALFMDCDMLCLTDIAEIWKEVEANPGKAVYVCQHDYSPAAMWGRAVLACGCRVPCRVDGANGAIKCDAHGPLQPIVCYEGPDGTKMDGQKQTTYPRKNWSSFMLFDCERCTSLTPQYVNTASGLELHRFYWVREQFEDIGALPLEWNVLVGEENQTDRPPKVIHYTNGGPWFRDYSQCPYANEWYKEHADMDSPPLVGQHARAAWMVDRAGSAA